MLKRTLYTALLLIAMFAFAFAIQQTARLLHLPLDLTANKGIGQILLYIVVLGCIVWFTRHIWKRNPLTAFAPYFRNRNRVARGFAVCAVASLIIQAPVYAILFRYGILRFSNHVGHKSLAVFIFNIVISLVVMVVLAATEEGIFRGFLVSYLRGPGKTSHVIWAIIFSSVIFALSHEFHTLNNWIKPEYYGKLAGLLLFGIMLAVTYQYTRSIACSIGLHTSFLWLDEIRRQTTMDIHQTYWWIGVNNDLRTAPFSWLIFLLFTVAFAIAGNRLRPVIAIEGCVQVPDHSVITAINQPSTPSTTTAPVYETASSRK